MSRFAIFALFFCVLTLSEVLSQDDKVCISLPRGPKGQVGSKGAQGQKGEPGDVTSFDCNSSDIAELKKQVRELRELHNLDSRSCSGVIYNNQCIKLAYTQGPAVKLATARQICRGCNGTLAEITSVAMYYNLIEYINSTWFQYTDQIQHYVDVWLGNTFQPIPSNENNLITLRNGTKVKLGIWRADFPMKYSVHGYRYYGDPLDPYVSILMRVSTSNDTTNMGIYNVHPYSLRNGLPLSTDWHIAPVPLCATPLQN